MLLLVVDMQKGLFPEETPWYDPEMVLRRINHLSKNSEKPSIPSYFSSTKALRGGCR